MYYSSDEQDTPDMIGKAFESHLKEKDTTKKTNEENKKEGTLQKIPYQKEARIGRVRNCLC